MSHHCAGCSTTAGMAGCPEHGRHSWSSSQVVVTHCQHGLDLRIHPRCYLCEPAATPAPLDVEARGGYLPLGTFSTDPPPMGEVLPIKVRPKVDMDAAPAPLDDSVRGEWGRQTCCPFPHDEDSGPDIHPRHQRTYQPATFAAAEETP